jgi:hypothetical protein
MSQDANSKRPGPEAYDHLWALLPVFAVFVAMILFFALADDRPMQIGDSPEFAPMPMMAPEPLPSSATDVSVPSAAEALARLSDVVAEPIATF